MFPGACKYDHAFKTDRGKCCLFILLVYHNTFVVKC